MYFPKCWTFPLRIKVFQIVLFVCSKFSFNLERREEEMGTVALASSTIAEQTTEKTTPTENESSLREILRKWQTIPHTQCSVTSMTGHFQIYIQCRQTGSKEGKNLADNCLNLRYTQYRMITHVLEQAVHSCYLNKNIKNFIKSE